MTKRALAAAAGLFTLGVSAFAQSPGDFRSVEFSLTPPHSFGAGEIFGPANGSYLGFPSLEFANEGRFSWQTAFLGVSTAAETLPSLGEEATVPRSRHRLETSEPDARDEMVNMRHRLFDYAGGEVGFSYGRSTGKYGGEVTRGYILGEVGNDKIHIIAGASYEEDNFRFPRRTR